MLASIAKDVPLRALRLVCSLFRMGVSITPKRPFSSHRLTQGGPGLFKQKNERGIVSTRNMEKGLRAKSRALVCPLGRALILD